MKKLVIAIAIMAITAFAQETFKHPGNSCRDVAILQQQMSLAVTDGDKVSMTLLLDFAKNGEPTTFANTCERIDAAIASVNQSWAGTAVATDFKKQYTHGNKAFFSELSTFSKANPTFYDLYLIIWRILNDDPEWSYQRAADCLLTGDYKANYVVPALDFLNRQFVALNKSDEEVASLLKRLNRIYSGKLIEDKDAWGGVVAQIRTMMETYK